MEAALLRHHVSTVVQSVTRRTLFWSFPESTSCNLSFNKVLLNKGCHKSTSRADPVSGVFWATVRDISLGWGQWLQPGLKEEYCHFIRRTIVFWGDAVSCQHLYFKISISQSLQHILMVSNGKHLLLWKCTFVQLCSDHLPCLCFPPFLRQFSLSHGLNIKRTLPWHWAIVLFFKYVWQSGCKFITSSFGLCSASAWHALCFCIGVFVPDWELEIRLRHFCTCIPFTSHLISR